jgi:hypothetical protein
MVDPIITIAAGMSVQSPFTRPSYNASSEILKVISCINNQIAVYLTLSLYRIGANSIQSMGTRLHS